MRATRRRHSERKRRGGERERGGRSSSGTPAGPPPVGTAVTALPPGCATDALNNVEYQRCGSTYYRATMQGSNLVYVVSQP